MSERQPGFESSDEIPPYVLGDGEKSIRDGLRDPFETDPNTVTEIIVDDVEALPLAAQEAHAKKFGGR